MTTPNTPHRTPKAAPAATASAPLPKTSGRTPRAALAAAAGSDAHPPKRPRGRPPLGLGESKAKNGAQHQANYRAKGKQIATVLTNADALAVLAAETGKGHTVAQVLEWALIEADRHRVN